MRRFQLAAVVLAGVGCGRIAFDELGPPADSDLALTPEVARTNLASRLTFVASGGEPPYSFARVSGTGELDVSTGVFLAPGYPGVATIEVTDTIGAVATAQVSFGGDMLYAAGGFVSSIARDEVWRSSDGMNWQVVGRLPAARGAGELLVLDDRLIFLGGSNMPDGVHYADIWTSDDGTAWTSLGQLPLALYASTAAVFERRLWLVGGRTPGDAYDNRVWSSSDGVTWQDETTLTSGIHGGEAAVVDDALWLVAGHLSSGQTARIWRRSADGSWVDQGNVPAAGEYHAVTVHAGELWVAGGLGLSERVVTTRDGVTWTDQPSLPLPRDYLSLVEWQDTMWVAGGQPAAIWRLDGDAWTVVGAFPVLTQGTAFVQFTPPSS